MRRMGCLWMIVILLLAVVAYDQWRIEQLRREVAAIAVKVHSSKPDKGKSAGNSDLVTSLAEAEQYTRQDKYLISNKKTAEAQTLLDKALSNPNSANGLSKDIIGGTAQYLGEAKDNAIEVFQKAWRDISEEPVPTKKTETKSNKKPMESK